MDINRKERIKKISSLVKSLKLEYKDDPNIIDITWGMAKRSNKLKPEVAIIFLVKEKYYSNTELEAVGSKSIPSQIEKFATDVQEEKSLRSLWAGSRNDKMADPLVGGVASANLETIERTFFWRTGGGRGTLGILCRDAEGNAMALSNWHVWADGGAEIGDRIIQPSTPEGGTYAESIAKVAACGPLLSQLTNKAPSPLAEGLYAGAAAAGILAGATDHKDPIRRGQELTTIDSDTFTHEERLQLSFEYPTTIPWISYPFTTDVDWSYNRQTNNGEQDIGIQEQRINPQFLLGQAVAPSQARYQPGDEINLQAAIWDYQERPEDAYHVTAHMVAVNQPDFALRTILHPAPCRRINLAPRYKERRFQEANPITSSEGGNLICVNFRHYSPSAGFPESESFGPFSIYQKADKALQIVRFSDEFGSALLIPQEGLSIHHAPASSIRLQVAQFTDSPVVVRAFNGFGRLLGEETAPNEQGEEHELTLSFSMISRVEIGGGGGEGILLSYCITPATESSATTIIPTDMREAFSDIEVPFINGLPSTDTVFIRRFCFRGRRKLPLNVPTGRYRIYLTVSNINQTPRGTSAEEAAKVIGGQEIGGQSQAAGAICGFLLLGDHVFDIF